MYTAYGGQKKVCSIGRRSQRHPSGAQARRDPRPLPRQVALPFLTGPLWPPSQTHRRLLARDEGHHRGRTLFSRPAATLPTYPSGADGTARAPYLYVSLVAHAASDFTGPASWLIDGSP